MNDYTYQDMMRMQSEAKKRVLEMHKRSKDIADNFNGTKSPVPARERETDEQLPRVPKTIKYPAELHSQVRRNVNTGHSSLLNVKDIRNALYSVFGRLTDEDYEKMFILSLCLLLTKDGADDSLIMSLMYLLS